MEFFKIWKSRSGVIGVNRMSLQELVGANIMGVVLFVVILLLLVQILPFLLMGMYIIMLLNNRISEEDTAYDTQQRLLTNVLGMLSVGYFLLDFHFGWICFSVFGASIYKETYDNLAILNTSLGLINVILFLVGHELYKFSPTSGGRLIIFGLVLFFGLKFVKPISTYIVGHVVTQYNDANIMKIREEMKIQQAIDDEYNSNSEERIEEERQKEEKREEKLRKFDEDYADKYLKH